MSPGEGARHIVNPIKGTQKELDALIPEEVLKELRMVMRPLERLQDDFQGARMCIRNTLRDSFPTNRKAKEMTQLLAEDNITQYEASPNRGRMAFCVADQEIMTFDANGDIRVKGRLVENDKAVVDSFKEWFESARQGVK
jgi:hypothetical protein